MCIHSTLVVEWAGIVWVQVLLVDEVLALCTGMVEVGGAGTVWVRVRLVLGGGTGGGWHCVWGAGTVWVLVGLGVGGAGTLFGYWLGWWGGWHCVGTG